ncbi:hypothetical protein, partial [Anaerostipes hadrus]|uniref:hypothetical protein n=1 Tax=Anaerostipes hadrus TaxID=649756 RepID=UPI001ADDC682
PYQSYNLQLANLQSKISSIATVFPPQAFQTIRQDKKNGNASICNEKWHTRVAAMITRTHIFTKLLIHVILT